MAIKRFVLFRHQDVSGVSGVGIVAEGAQFSDGRCVIVWLGPLTSVVIHANIENVVKLHGHDGKTEVRMIDD